jgi:hypothetical protein
MGRLERNRAYRFNQNDPGPHDVEVPVGQDIVFGTFDIDLEEMDVLVGDLVEDRRQRPHLDFMLTHFHARSQERAGDTFLDGRQSAIAEVEQHGLARNTAERELHRLVTLPLSPQLLRVKAIRLDIDARPAAFVKGEGDGQIARIMRANIDVETSIHIVERSPQKDVLPILSVRYNTARRVRHLFTSLWNWEETPILIVPTMKMATDFI